MTTDVDQRHSALVDAWRSVALAEDKLEAFQAAALKVCNFVDRGEIDKADAIDVLIALGDQHDIFHGDHAREDLEHLIAQAMLGLRALAITPATNGAGARYDNVWNIRDRQAAPPPAIALQSVETFLSGFVPPDYLIDSIIQRRFVYALTGQTGHAKTAIALLMAELIACPDHNAMLGRHRVAKGRVVYFVGENPDDVRMRLIGANSLRHDDPFRDNIYFVPGQFNIVEMRRGLADEFTRLGGIDLIIIDTSAAYFLGKDELDNVAMGAHARMLRTLTELPGYPAILALCHPVKRVEASDQLLPRGGGAFLAEMDGNLTAFRIDDETIELSYSKMRGPGFQPIRFKLEGVSTTELVDAQGRLLPTVRARALTEAQILEQDFEFTREIDRMLVVMNKYPDHSLTQWAEDLNWFIGGRSGEANQIPYKMKVLRIIRFIEDKAKPALVKRNLDKPRLTEEGMKAALRAEGRVRATAQQNEQETLL